ncbi:b5821794-a48d-49ae-843c-4e1c1f304287-CDS [Sclerotinia trifoliorum]|uniref:B5821794-a48d-49ae-843c-4e1c1f304287-CDS n=1 Tax=Sclerotinia trifoliorum TaxID=28548 RepID=A0A8H2W6A3_9HELO|nr:b5821794-a48d-49ae-843c-4e1c1f304287-CDS [Sclerotinia trifoliorum]
MGLTNIWYCLSCKTSQYRSISAVRPCKYCNFMMSIWHEPGCIPAVPVYIGATTSITKDVASRSVEQTVDDEKGNDKSAMGWWGSRG